MLAGKHEVPVKMGATYLVQFYRGFSLKVNITIVNRFTPLPTYTEYIVYSMIF